METENKNLKPCKACNELVSKSAKKCPKCGQDQRGFFMRHKFITGFLVLMLIGVIGSLLDPQEPEVKEREVAVNSTPEIQEVKMVTTEQPAVKDVKETDSVPREHKAALKKADTYANTMYMSKDAVYAQLISEYGENFPEDAAKYAVENVVADWNDNALQKAKIYAEEMSMSDSAIYEQLISEYGEQFTESQAQYAIDNL